MYKEWKRVILRNAYVVAIQRIQLFVTFLLWFPTYTQSVYSNIKYLIRLRLPMCVCVFIPDKPEHFIYCNCKMVNNNLATAYTHTPKIHWFSLRLFAFRSHFKSFRNLFVSSVWVMCFMYNMNLCMYMCVCEHEFVWMLGLFSVSAGFISLSLSLIFGNLQWKIQKLRKKASKRLRMRLGKQLAPLQRNISTFFCRFSHWFLLISNFSLFVLSNLRFSNCILSLFILFSFVRPLKINQTEHKQNAHTNTKSTRMDLTEFGQRERESLFHFA